MWFVLAFAAFAQEPTQADAGFVGFEEEFDLDLDTDQVIDASNCGLTVTREVVPKIATALPAGSAGCSVRMTIDENGRVSNVEALECPDDVTDEIRPTLDKWRFERTNCPVDDPLSFDTTFETDSQTWLIPSQEPVTGEVFVPPEGTEGCLMAATLLPDGSLENVRSSDPSCGISLGGSGWNPQRFWRAEISGLRCRATFEARNGLANNVEFEGCTGPSRLPLVSFIERAAWSHPGDEPVSYDIRFRLRDDESAPLDRASQEGRYIRDACEAPDAPGFLTRRTQIPAMPARWTLDQTELAAYCRLRVHLNDSAIPTRIDAVLCSGAYGPRAAAAASQWTYQAPTCGETATPSEVVVLVPFAKRNGVGFGAGTSTVELSTSTRERASQLDHCEMWIDIPSNGNVRIQTSDQDQCYVIPSVVSTLRLNKLLKWEELVQERGIECVSTFTAETTKIGDAEIGSCYLGTREKVQEAIDQWSWSVLGRESETYTIHWNFRTF
ncbi:MAG: hypothetical protein ACI855_000673 [Myxococcota bacterium]|jgi:hypothetical protein